jgi:hypothetical protein
MPLYPSFWRDNGKCNKKNKNKTLTNIEKATINQYLTCLNVMSDEHFFFFFNSRTDFIYNWRNKQEQKSSTEPKEIYSSKITIDRTHSGLICNLTKFFPNHAGQMSAANLFGTSGFCTCSLCKTSRITCNLSS